MQHRSEIVRPRQMLQGTSSVDTTIAAPPSMALVALVVERTLPDALAIGAVLTDCGFQVTVAESFVKAKERLSARPPAILIAEIRLAEYNGLHLVLRGKSLRADMAALVTSTIADPVLKADAEAMGATFVLKPCRDSDLEAAVFRTLFNVAHPHASQPVRPPFERRKRQRRAVARTREPERRTGDRRQDPVALLRTLAAHNLNHPL
jgi:DNA-binding NtrC family response regulator